MIELMTREEMLERLKNGEDPWKIIFNKWNRIKKRCKLDGPHDLPIDIFGASCVLCEIHTVESSSTISCYGNEHGLLPCPLVQIGERCSDGNTWGEFARCPSVETSQLMINTLIRAKKGIIKKRNN